MGQLFWKFGDKEDSLAMMRERGNIWGVPLDRVVVMDQVHSNLVKVVERADLGSGFSKLALPIVDAICTDMEDILLVVKSADCVPILFYDKTNNAVAGAHSGRLGTQRSICTEVCKKMKAEYGTEICDLQVRIGPGIGVQNYEVSSQIYEQFVEETGVEQPMENYLDLKRVIVADLVECGVKRENIECSAVCTYEDERYFSYRRDKDSGRQLSVIGVMNGTNI